MMKRLIGGAAILALVATAAFWRLNMEAGVPRAAAQTPGQAIPVTAGTVAVEDVPVFLHGIGTVQAYNTVAIKSRVDGQIVKINFKEGEEVKVGDPLFQIDPRPYQAALETAQIGIRNFLDPDGKQSRATTSKRRRSSSFRPRSRVMQRRSRMPNLTSATPISARRSTVVWAQSWSMSAISCMRMTTRRWS